MPEAGYVYIVHGVGTNYIKIGKSSNPLQRLQTLEQNSPFPLRLISIQIVADMDAAEQDLHERYAPYLSRGEWFALPPHLLAPWPLEAVKTTFFSPQRSARKRQRRGSQSARAQEWLHAYLARDAMRAAEVEAAAQAVGISAKMLRRARERLQVHSYKAGLAWYWRLPEPEALSIRTQEL